MALLPLLKNNPRFGSWALGVVHFLVNLFMLKKSIFSIIYKSRKRSTAESRIISLLTKKEKINTVKPRHHKGTK